MSRVDLVKLGERLRCEDDGTVTQEEALALADLIEAAKLASDNLAHGPYCAFAFDEAKDCNCGRTALAALFEEEGK